MRTPMTSYMKLMAFIYFTVVEIQIYDFLICLQIQKLFQSFNFGKVTNQLITIILNQSKKFYSSGLPTSNLLVESISLILNSNSADNSGLSFINCFTLSRPCPNFVSP